MVSKFGKKFENVLKLFDHAAHNGSNYLNGHCFVSIMLCVPVLDHDKISYLSVPLGYRMWQKKESKLELAASMIRQVMPEFLSKEHVIILCDSWYTKKNLVSIIDEYPNLDLIGNARIDSVMYDLAPERTGRRGRPAKHGKRLFFSTIFSEDLKVFCTEEEHSSSDQTDHDPVNYIPLLLYAFRWKIEIGDYEQKTFWSFCDYMVRSRKGIETHIKSETMIKALKQLICQQVCHL